MNEKISFDARITFEKEQGQFTGQIEIVLPSGRVWRPDYFEFHTVLAAHFWLRKEVDELIDWHARSQSELVQTYHKAYMQSKYPGWPNIPKDPTPRPIRRVSTGPAPKLTLEDLGLAPKKIT